MWISLKRMRGGLKGLQMDDIYYEWAECEMGAEE